MSESAVDAIVFALLFTCFLGIFFELSKPSDDKDDDDDDDEGTPIPSCATIS